MTLFFKSEGPKETGYSRERVLMKRMPSLISEKVILRRFWNIQGKVPRGRSN